MKISVVIPAFNEESLLGKCLESFKRQEFLDEYEIIVVDNASTDHTADVARSYGVKLVFEPHKGVVSARRAGANAAKGEIIIQADADTSYPADWLKRLYCYFLSHPRNLAVSGAYVYDAPPRWAPIEHTFRGLVNLFGSALLGRPPLVSGAAFAFCRDAYEKTGGYNENWLNPDQWGIAQHLRQFGLVGYDPHLVCVTSPRRVWKSLTRIIKDIFVHLLSAVQFIFNHIGATTWVKLKRSIGLSENL